MSDYWSWNNAVDGVGTVIDVTRVESTARIRIAFADVALAPLFIPKGSVAVEGVSLTVAALGAGMFEIMLIPHTLAVTTLAGLRCGQRVNIEADVIGKYLQRALALSEEARRISWKAQQRLHKRYITLMARGKHKGQIATALAREMLGFLWAIAVHAEAQFKSAKAA